MFNEEDFFEKQVENNKFADNISKMFEYSRSYSRLGLSNDWNLDDIDENLIRDFNKNLDIKKTNEKEDTKYNRFFNEESLSISNNENIYRLNKTNEILSKILYKK